MLARKSLTKKRTLILGGTMAVIWGIIGIVLYRNYFSSPAPPPPVLVVELKPEISGETPAAVLPKELGLEVLRESRLIDLKLFGEVPLEVKALGREDPFTSLNP
jgi:hypothetical protein